MKPDGGGAAVKLKRAFVLFALLNLFTTPSFAQDAPNISALRSAKIAGTNQMINTRALLGNRALIMFWASDCAPCLVEMRGFNAIKRAANMPIIIVTEDWGRREQALLAPQKAAGAIILHAPNNFNGLLEYFGDPENSVPYSLMINENSIGCIAHLGILTAPKLREMQVECSKS